MTDLSMMAQTVHDRRWAAPIARASDAVASELLGDANVFVIELSAFDRTMLPSSPASVQQGPTHEVELPVAQKFKPKNGCMITARRILVLLSIVFMVTLLIADSKVDAMHGLVPGLADTVQTSITSFDKLSVGEENKAMGNGTSPKDIIKVTCSCTFSTKARPPVWQLDIGDTDFLSALRFCSHMDGERGPELLMNSTLPNFTRIMNQTAETEHQQAFQYLWDTLINYYQTLIMSEIWPPRTPMLLTYKDWNGTMFMEAQSRMATMANAEHYTRFRSPASTNVLNLLSEEHKQSFVKLGEHFLDALFVSFMAMVGKAWGVTDVTNIKDSFRPDTKEWINLNCSAVPPELQLTSIFWCGYDSSGNVENNCTYDKAYMHYTEWCTPADCVVIKMKNGYLRAMEGFAAVGGAYGLMTLILYTVLWRVCCFLDKRVDGSATCIAQCLKHCTGKLRVWLDSIVMMVYGVARNRSHLTTVVWQKAAAGPVAA